MFVPERYCHLKMAYGLRLLLSAVVFVVIALGVQVEQKRIWLPNQEIVNDVTLNKRPNVQYSTFQVLKQNPRLFQVPFDGIIVKAVEKAFNELLIEKVKLANQNFHHLDFSNRFYKLKQPQKISDPLVILS